MLKPLAAATAITLIALAAQAQDGAVVPAAQAPAANAASSSSLVSSAPTASSATSSSSVVDTGTIATLDFPGASSSSASGQPAKPVVVPPDKKTLRRMTDAIVTYVRNQRGWMDGTYKVYFYGYDNDLTIMAIDLTQGDNAYNFVGAEGQPFKVEVDPKTFAIIAEQY